MLLSLSPIISSLIEDNITRQWGPAHHSASMARSVERASLLKAGLVMEGGVCCVSLCVCVCVHLNVLELV